MITITLYLTLLLGALTLSVILFVGLSKIRLI